MNIIIDNYDSFTYNLYQYIGEIDPDVAVWRNDEITVDEIEEMNPEHIIISPGPKYPKDAGICIELIGRLFKKIPILGVCLGHQSIGEAMGGKTVHAPRLMHGKDDTTKILSKESVLFEGIEGDEIRVGRYHSLVTDEGSLPQFIKVTAKTDDGSVMAMEHREYPLFGLQFHPESVLTPEGKKILRNFLNIKK